MRVCVDASWHVPHCLLLHVASFLVIPSTWHTYPPFPSRLHIFTHMSDSPHPLPHVSSPRSTSHICPTRIFCPRRRHSFQTPLFVITKAGDQYFFPLPMNKYESQLSDTKGNTNTTGKNKYICFMNWTKKKKKTEAEVECWINKLQRIVFYHCKKCYIFYMKGTQYGERF